MERERRLTRLGRPGEVRVRLSLLRMDQTEVDCLSGSCSFMISFPHSPIPQFFKPLLDSIVRKGMTVLEFKKQFIQEAYNQGIEYPLQLDR